MFQIEPEKFQNSRILINSTYLLKYLKIEEMNSYGKKEKQSPKIGIIGQFL